MPWKKSTVAEIRAALVERPPMVILWGLSSDQSGGAGGGLPLELIRTLAATGLGFRAAPLQLAALPASFGGSSTQTQRLVRLLRQLGMALVLEAPEDFPMAVRMATSYLRESLGALGESSRLP